MKYNDLIMVQDYDSVPNIKGNHSIHFDPKKYLFYRENQDNGHVVVNRAKKPITDKSPEALLEFYLEDGNLGKNIKFNRQ